MANSIHPTAYIAPGVILGDNVAVGAYAVIEPKVVIVQIAPLAHRRSFRPYVQMGGGNIVHPQVVLGDLPQDTSFKAETVSWLHIGDPNVFREGFTAHRASIENAVTRIGSGCYFINNSHVAHDCDIGDKTIFAKMSQLAALLLSAIMSFWAGMWWRTNFVESARMPSCKGQLA